jgi:hypothetical protein
MLIDLDLKTPGDPIFAILTELTEPDKPFVERRSQGIYEINHFNFDMVLEASLGQPIDVVDFEKAYPEFGDDFNCYGVCDNYQQILDQCSELQNPNRKFIISVTKVSRSDQPSEGGWRWHKWGPYIGVHESTCEYLYDEPLINEVYVYHIYEL